MDLTDPAKFDEWVYRLTFCDDCDGTDEWFPLVVLVDGVTSILNEVGKGGEHYYPDWFAAFKRLLRVVGIPNGLPTGHSFNTVNRLIGGVESMAGPDGVWIYTSDDPLDPTAQRRFSVTPRSIGPVVASTPVRIGEDGRLSMGVVDADQRSGGGSSRHGKQAADDSLGIEERVLAYVAGCNGDNRGPTSTEIREQGFGRNPDVDAALASLTGGEEPKLVVRPGRSRGGGEGALVK